MPTTADLIDAAVGPPPPEAPAVDVALALGRRALRRRRVAYGVGAAATALVIGGAAWAVAPGGDAGPGREDAPAVTTPSASDTPADQGPKTDPSDRDGDRGSDRDSDQGAEVWPGTPRDDLVRFSQPQLSLPEPGTLIPVQDTEIVEQRPGADVGDSFAAPDDVTGVALVVSEGSRLFVLARIIDGGPADYIAVPADGELDSVDAFLDFARERYAEGGGGLL